MQKVYGMWNLTFGKGASCNKNTVLCCDGRDGDDKKCFRIF